MSHEQYTIAKSKNHNLRRQVAESSALNSYQFEFVGQVEGTGVWYTRLYPGRKWVVHMRGLVRGTDAGTCQLLCVDRSKQTFVFWKTQSRLLPQDNLPPVILNYALTLKYDLPLFKFEYWQCCKTSTNSENGYTKKDITSLLKCSKKIFLRQVSCSCSGPK